MITCATSGRSGPGRRRKPQEGTPQGWRGRAAVRAPLMGRATAGAATLRAAVPRTAVPRAAGRCRDPRAGL
eukprot:5833554-Heterocapsa_arctica.AAC.1